MNPPKPGPPVVMTLMFVGNQLHFPVADPDWWTKELDRLIAADTPWITLSNPEGKMTAKFRPQSLVGWYFTPADGSQQKYFQRQQELLEEQVKALNRHAEAIEEQTDALEEGEEWKKDE